MTCTAPRLTTLRATLLAASLATTALLPLSSAHAALFSDDEARKAILELRAKVDAQGRDLSRAQERINELQTRSERLESASRNNLELANEIESLRAEVTKLRGQLESQTNELAQTQRRQKDLYNDVEGRLQRFEPITLQLDGREIQVEPTEKKAYDSAIQLFRNGDYKGALAGFERVRRDWPRTAYLPSLLYWSGNAQYALKDYKGALATQTELVKAFPDHVRAPDALLNAAANQLELGDKRAARRSLETILERYRDSQAAVLAKERLPATR